MQGKGATDMLHDTTQPFVMGIGGAVIAGVTIDDMLIIGALVLLCLNVPIAAIRLYNMFKNKEDK